MKRKGAEGRRGEREEHGARVCWGAVSADGWSERAEVRRTCSRPCSCCVHAHNPQTLSAAGKWQGHARASGATACAQPERARSPSMSS